MFCNIYFGNIESILLDDVIDKRTSHIIRGSTTSNCDAAVAQCNSHIHLLVRIVDDFLLISTCKDTSTRFLTKLSRGIPGLGVKINSEKSRASYQVSIKNSSTGKMEAVSVCRDYFPWCGLLIDTRTCEIRLDYKRFGGSHAIDTVVIHRTGNEGMYLKKKMKDFVRPRCCQKLLFSSWINGIDTIQSNFYQMFLLCAIKLLHYMNGCGDETASLTHQNFIYNSAVDTISYAYLLISSKIRHGRNERAAAKSSSDDDMTFQLSWIDALWLGKQAFFRVFQQSAGHTAQLSHSFYDSSAGTSNVKQLLKVIRRTHRMFPIDDV
jgi:telomerase reverse transcriptase